MGARRGGRPGSPIPAQGTLYISCSKEAVAAAQRHRRIELRFFLGSSQTGKRSCEGEMECWAIGLV